MDFYLEQYLMDIEDLIDAIYKVSLYTDEGNDIKQEIIKELEKELEV